MGDVVKLWLQDAEETHSAGASLAASLYRPFSTILLTGDLGTGKTTLLRGFANGMGVSAPVVSPTFALEQRYSCRDGRTLLHLDLYRLSPQEAARVVRSTEETAVRCIEWADRLPPGHVPPDAIRLHLAEERDGRLLEVAFEDVPLPSADLVEQWRRAAKLPEHIIAHCEAVATFCAASADHLLTRGRIVRKRALAIAAALHDLLRFLDFRSKTGPGGYAVSADEERVWEQWRVRFPRMRHEEACAAFLREEGFEALAQIVEPHGLRLPSPERATTEQKLLFYADKRVLLDQVVTLEARFTDFRNRYGRSAQRDEHGRIWYEEALQVERELFPSGPPL